MRSLQVALIMLSFFFQACRADLSLSPGDSGSLTGYWKGAFFDEGELSLMVLRLEQHGQELYGIMEFSNSPYEAWAPAAADKSCNILDGNITEGIASFKYPTGDYADLIVRLSYSAKKESLEGLWGADTSLASRSGKIQLKRYSWFPLRDTTTGGVTLINCVPNSRPRSVACVIASEQWIVATSELKDTKCDETTGLNSISQCNDGIDNDSDGLIDNKDPGCLIPYQPDDTDPFFQSNAKYYPLFLRRFESPPPCIDGLDNDGDKLIDSEDPQCVLPWSPSE